MSGSLVFLSWRRSGIFQNVTSAATFDGIRRLQGSLELRLEERDGPRVASHDAGFALTGPGDVSALNPRGIRRMMPPPNSASAETTKCAHVEFAAADLPWRFTPEQPANNNNAILRPWLVLVVGTVEEPGFDDAEIELLGDNMIRLARPVLEDHDLQFSARWAHVQIALDSDHPGLEAMSPSQLEVLIDQSGLRPVARLLSPRALTPNRRHIAAIVPAFKPDGSQSWDLPAPQSVEIPVYHFWRFRSGAGGDFRTMAARLRAGAVDTSNGSAALTYDRLPQPHSLNVRGALSPIGGADELLDAAVAQDVDSLTAFSTDERGRRVVAPPIYGKPWREDPRAPAWTPVENPPWGAAVNSDPRHRGVGGLGAEAGIEMQEIIVDAVKSQAGAVAVAAQRINQLVLGMSAAASLWNKHLPLNSRHRLQIYGPSMRRMITANGPVLAQVAGGTHPLPPGIFSTAARRILRSGPARTDLAQPGANAPDAVIDEANTCPPPPDRSPPHLPHGDGFAGDQNVPPLEEIIPSHEPPDMDAIHLLLEKFFNELPEYIRDTLLEYNFIGAFLDCIMSGMEIDWIKVAQLLSALLMPDPDLMSYRDFNCESIAYEPDGLDDFEDEIIVEPPDRPCDPIDLEQLEDDISGAIDPTVPDPWIQVVVTSTIDGLDPVEPLSPVEICTGVDLPTWRFLRDSHPDWLLPGVGQLATDRVFAFENNPAFTEAFLLGINNQTVGELRWRNLPIATGCTPLKMFWGRVAPDDDERLNDIRGFNGWTDTSILGDSEHNPNPGDNTNAVLVVRSDLFHRYPETLVSVVAATEIDGVPQFGRDHQPAENAMRIWPIFQGSIGEDVTFFGFPMTPADGRRHWILLEEPSSGYRFRSDIDGGPATPNDGGQFARDLLNVPTRVLISGAELIPEQPNV